jgi:DNA-binding NarL/FixJ family response regulator
VVETRTPAPPGVATAPVVVAGCTGELLGRITAALRAGGVATQVVVPGQDATMAARRARRATIAFGCDVSDAGGMASLRSLRKGAPGAAIVVVCPATHSSAVRRALEGGADAVVFEPQLEDSLVASIAAVVTGQTVVPRRCRGGLHRPAFSHRERQVLACIAKGLTNRQIADALFLSESTIKSHLSSAFAKLGVRSRREAIAALLDSPDGLGAQLIGSDDTE